MIAHINRSNFNDRQLLLDGMFRDRKRVFVDILKWDVPVDGPHERDQFDNEDAEYFVVADKATGRHCGSMRVLRTDGPHILGDLFPSLCDGAVPSGDAYRELTRLCLSPDLRARERLQVRNQLFTALVEYALMTGIRGYTGVAEMGWYQQLLALGWRCTPLGLPRMIDGSMVAALLAHVEPETINLFRRAGTFASGELTLAAFAPQAA